MPSIFLAANTKETTLLSQFLNAKGDKYIIVRSCKADTTESLPVYICSDFITRDTYLDHFVCFVNEPFLIDKKYRFNSAAREFKVWFKNIQGESVAITDFVLEMGLVYA